MSTVFSRRLLLRGGIAAAGAGMLQACGSSKPLQTAVRPAATAAAAVFRPNASSGNTMLRLIASSGFCADPARVQTGINRLTLAGFQVGNQEAAYRRFQRFAGTDGDRIADFQDVASGRVPTPKVLMGVRGGYGAQRLLPHIDFASLGDRMREQGTLFFGFSDVCALQLALLAKSGVPSFAGPMLYSEFGKAEPSSYTMESFIAGSTEARRTLTVGQMQARAVQADGILWGGNLSVLSALVGSPYLPDIRGGILFLEDVGEQPYRIERMLQTLLLAGVLQRQQALVLGDFRMGGIRDVYDGGYDFSTVVQAVARAARIPVLTGFPFGHIADKTTFPLGAQASLRSTADGGYSITFEGYPVLDKARLNLDSLLPPADPVFLPGIFSGAEEPAESE